MYISQILFACLSIAIQCSALSSPSNNILQVFGLEANELGATVFALLYGSPLLQFYQEVESLLLEESTNFLGHRNATAVASTRGVVRPNVDTMYASGAIDLTATDLVFTVPPMEEGRFYLFAFYDPYGDNFASIGSVSANKPGDYLLRTTDGSCDDYAGCITSPTPIGSLLVRVEVKNNGTDTTSVDAYLTNCNLTTVNPKAPSLPALTLSDFSGLSNSTVVSTLQLLARFESRAAPEAATFQASVPEILALAGISNGTYSQPASVNLTSAAVLTNASISAFTNSSSNYPSLGNGWSALNSSLDGTFDNGKSIIARAITGIELYLQNTADNAIYPTLGSTVLSLTGNESYIFTFSGKPPVASDGFWSLTMYDDTGYLVANPQNTYAVGDRSNITFTNGDLVYAANASDGVFQVLVQDANVIPPSNWTANWLPAPAGGGSFTITFRLYAPTPALSNGSYVYPLVTKGNAVVSSNSTGSTVTSGSLKSAVAHYATVYGSILFAIAAAVL